ncbi:hypothetical protein DSO57_1004258 [Entomophthora muscae]|uniref:Uncharacterized protein n=1 Tax=Entomophthora muscae TaxID=34485 RepID=A0ACC2RZ61_9FUNG|nr:hypothetical protein DSO57_1004258 [Entomophthora muscae]
MIRASLQTGPEGLVAPNGRRAISSNSTNELGGSHQLVNDFCWVIQQIQYQLGLLNNLENKTVPVPTNSANLSKFKVPSPVPSPSPDSLANLQLTFKNNTTLPTDVMKHYLLEDVPVFSSNQTNSAKKDPQAFETLTMPAVSNHFIGSRSDEQPLNQEYSPAINNSPAQKQVQIAEQPQPQIIEQVIISRQSAFSNPTNPQMKPDEPNPDPRAFPSHELSSQSHNPSPENFPSTKSKILGTLSPIPKNAFPIPKVPVTKGWTTGAHQGATSSCFQGRADKWYKNHFPPIRKDADNVK